MNSQFVIRFLTGDLVGVLIASAILTWPVSWLLLALYTRAVRRSMRRSGGAARTEADRAGLSRTPDPSASAARAASPPIAADALGNELRVRPWQAARVYVAAAIGYGATMAVVMAWVSDPQAPFAPVRLLLLTTSFAWPIVLTVGIVAAATRRRRLQLALGYAAIYAALAALALARSSTTSASQLLMLWVLHNLPSTVLVALALSRRIRAVGPMVLLFLVLALAGADMLIAVTGASDSLMLLSFDISQRVGLGAISTIVALAGIGFIAFAVIGGVGLFWIRRRYERKLTSDESLAIVTIWWLFAFGHAIELAFEHLLAPLAGVLAMGIFLAITRIGFAHAVTERGPGHRLLLLRSFSIGARAEQFFDAFQKHWRRVGSIEMIAGFDLAMRAIEPHEFLDFIVGRVSRRFIDGPAALEQRLREMDLRPDRDGRFRVNEFFCYDDTWRSVLQALVHESDAVLMDLRGFSRQNAGCVFEIRELLRHLPAQRIVFMTDAGTDVPFLNETCATASAEAGGPAGTGEPQVLSCPALDDDTLRQVLDAVARAVRPIAAEYRG